MAKSANRLHRLGGKDDRHSSEPPSGRRPDTQQRLEVSAPKTEEKDGSLHPYANPCAKIVPGYPGKVVFQVPNRHTVPLLAEKSQHGTGCVEPLRIASGPLSVEGGLQPLHRRYEPCDTRQVVGEQGKRLVQERPIARGVVISKVGAEGHKTCTLEKRVLLQGLHHIVEALMLLGHHEVACALGFFEQACVF
jgi:hypothetical protein